MGEPLELVQRTIEGRLMRGVQDLRHSATYNVVGDIGAGMSRSSASSQMRRSGGKLFKFRLADRVHDLVDNRIMTFMYGIQRDGCEEWFGVMASADQSTRSTALAPSIDALAEDDVPLAEALIQRLQPEPPQPTTKQTWRPGW